MALTESTMLELGTMAPDFVLTNAITGKTIHATSSSREMGFTLPLFRSS